MEQPQTRHSASAGLAVQQSDANLALFRLLLLEWWRDHARSYPWRRQQSAYAIAIAEIMLRRTRADQVVRVYERFLADYPTLSAAAAADPDTIREHLWPLGLAWRADALVAFVREAHAEFGDNLPVEAAVLRELPGVGDYVSAAIACFAANSAAVPLIDTNGVRVLGRVFGLDTRGEARRRRAMRELAARAVDPDKPAAYHYAILDFAAQVCTARNPRCAVCPLSVDARCEYYRTEVAPGKPDLPTAAEQG